MALKRCICLFETVTERDKESEESSIGWFTSQKGAKASAGSGQNQEPEIPSGSPLLVAETQTRGLSRLFPSR